ncbi:hypothetical protein pkur_cds_797 [Pandoravirus kuranda]|uniref:Uncharacterized protein n=1 Tax=Pandoravirus kuranda TaxID=3019033 RepID=A0AA95J831_9VIRU|nr:hypothetical protein pkur_cds_797 [Pandoravirus kuranda]
MDLVDTRARIIKWYLRLGLAQRNGVQDRLAWLADHWYLAVDAEFARQAQRAYECLVGSGVSVEWRPRSWERARVTVVIAAAPHDLLALVPAVVSRGWKPSKRSCALVVMDDWNPAWWTQWSTPTTGGRLDVCATLSDARNGHDNVILDAREASVAKVREALDDAHTPMRVVIVRDRTDAPLDGVDTVVCACACRQAPESHLRAIDRYRARVFYPRRSVRPTEIAFSPWTGARHDGHRNEDAIQDHSIDGMNNNTDNHADVDDDRHDPWSAHCSDRRVCEGGRPGSIAVPMRDCASFDCGCCLPLTPVWVETRERCPFVGGCVLCD